MGAPAVSRATTVEQHPARKAPEDMKATQKKANAVPPPLSAVDETLFPVGDEPAEPAEPPSFLRAVDEIASEAVERHMPRHPKFSRHE